MAAGLRRAGAVVAVVIAVSGCSAGRRASTAAGPVAGSPAPTSSPRRRVVLVGDSMANEAARELRSAAVRDGVDLELHTLGKAGPCNQLGVVEQALGSGAPVVAVEWIGNTSFTSPCTRAFYPVDVAAETRRALEQIAVRRKAGTVVVLVGIPPIAQTPWDASRTALDPLYRAWAAAHPGFVYADTTEAVAPGGQFRESLPCLPDDTAAGACGTLGAPDGQAVVRDPIGLHFCPVRYELDVAQCPVWSSGAHRYADAVLTVVSRLVR